MAGISSKALKPNYAENKIKFNDGSLFESKEFSDGSGLELYDATFRLYDPQIGRFHQIDPLADMTEDWSPYSFAFNNPISFNDPFGLTSDTTTLQEVVVTPSNNRSGSQVVCMSCNQPAPDPSRALHPTTDPGSLEFVDETEDTKENPVGFINKAPDWLYETKPGKAFGLDASFYILDFFGVNALDDYIHRRSDGQNSGGQLMLETAQLILAGAGPKGRGPRKGPIWTKGKTTSVKNAYSHWRKHRNEFPEYYNASQYVKGVYDFINNPPPGTLTRTRPGTGEKLYYHPASNTFAVTTAAGVPKTMFRPNEGLFYWSQQ